jgi:predicted metal-binding protein
MMEGERQHKERFDAFCRCIDESDRHLPLGAGTCTYCEKCTYPDAPCRFPKRLRPSMEAFGLLVTDVCAAADIPYYYGPRTLTYTCCVLFPEK